jgi:hypothetical protein
MLKAAYISRVVWNMAAFDSLVVDPDTKEMVKALVTNQLEGEKATDLMDGKGNGLVILLHGFVNALLMRMVLIVLVALVPAKPLLLVSSNSL